MLASCIALSLHLVSGVAVRSTPYWNSHKKKFMCCVNMSASSPKAGPNVVIR